MEKRIVLLCSLLVGSLTLWGFPLMSGLQAAMFWKKPPLDVIYEPTSYAIAEEMLDMAEVSPKDLVYDLGCGDGRIVIMAAKRRGARGVGVDLDPDRIKESLRNAAAEGVSEQVSFNEQNLFDAEIANASVVMLYLFPDVNLRLRPKLLKELKPGTRIVSHSHSMGEWEADSSKKVHGHTLYLFIVPANVTGTWHGAEVEGRSASLTLTQRFQQVKGSMTLGAESYPIRSCSLMGGQLTFSIERNVKGAKRMLFFEGRVSGASMEGKMVHEGGHHAGGVWKAVRVPFTSVPIAE